MYGYRSRYRRRYSGGYRSRRPWGGFRSRVRGGYGGRRRYVTRRVRFGGRRY